ncbi:uncharacterized protein LOC115963837 [Quercus lobata]|uniref:uncharacterized protein LOC115963837 n=1 Tax=Quercus lobata TaxID=97700 RepID=UPI00124439B8|nr:uncharacterized protein LOC115963837 [Quercus lobata]
MSGDPLRHNQSLHCQYHQDRGHTTEDCRTLWNHLEQLVKEGKLQQFLYRPNELGDQSRSGAQGNASLRPPLGTINVIFAAPGRTGSQPDRMMSVARSLTEDPNSEPKRARLEIRPSLSFLDEDKIGTIQPHDDALVVTLGIAGYDVKMVMVDQGSCVEVMYPDLYRGLNLKFEDLTAYDSPLAGLEVVEVDFIVVDAYSPYTAIVARSWLHTLGVVSSNLYQKVKYPSGDRIEELVGNQSMARQCLVSTILHQPAAESSAMVKEGL